MKYIRMVMIPLIICVFLCASILYPSAAIGFDAETVYNSVFVITAGNSLGSGFAVGEDCVLTNVHVVQGAERVTVTSYSGQKYSATVYYKDAERDIAILAVAEAAFTPLPAADLDSAKIGDDIYAIGAPNSLAYTLTKGVISAKSRQVNGNNFIQIDAPINEGNSGGPLINDAGEVLGINTLKYSESEGLGFAIPIADAQALMEEAGMTLNSDGTVSGRISETNPSPTQPQETESRDPGSETEPTIVEPEPPKPSKGKNDSNSFVPIICAAAIAVALIATIILLIATRRRNHVVKPYDPSERTDFEIEIED